MIWIHGGAFMHGGSKGREYSGKRLATTGKVIVVSCNYRVGSFGFLVNTAAGIFGNFGLQDQKLALEV